MKKPSTKNAIVVAGQGAGSGKSVVTEANNGYGGRVKTVVVKK